MTGPRDVLTRRWLPPQEGREHLLDTGAALFAETHVSALIRSCRWQHSLPPHSRLHLKSCADHPLEAFTIDRGALIG